MVVAVAVAVALAPLTGCDYEAVVGVLPGPLAATDGGPADTLNRPPDVGPGPGCLLVDPPSLDFGTVSRGGVVELDVHVHNSCDVARAIERWRVVDDPRFELVAATRSGPGVEGAAGGVALDLAQPAPWAVPPGGRTTLTLAFAPAEDPTPAGGWLFLDTDDVGRGPTLPVRLDGNTLLPCLLAVRVGPAVGSKVTTVSFGGQLVGAAPAMRELELRACAPRPVRLDAITLSESSVFALDAASLPALPWTLQPGYPVRVAVTYAPESLAPTDPEGAPLALDAAELHIDADTFDPTLALPVTGWGTDALCGQAVLALATDDAQALEGLVTPGTPVHLDGTGSVPAVGELTAWTWTVTGPSGTPVALEALAVPGQQRFVPEVLGAYEIRLETLDEGGLASCVAADATVEVVPEGERTVELVWTTAADPDPLDEGPDAGADLDLHVRHPLATGADLDCDGELDGWFDVPFDCHWQNPAPMWPAIGEYAASTPTLDRDDTDGTGPERVSLQAGPAGARVAVHAFDDHGFGPSVATVRLWEGDVLVWESEPRELAEGDLWEVVELGPLGAPPTPMLDPDKAPIVWPIGLGCPPPFGVVKP